MKNIVIITFCLLFSVIVKSQARYEFSYDNNGNRTQRIYYSSKSAKDTTTTDSTAIATENTTTADNSQTEQQQEFHALLGEQIITVFPNPTKGELQLDITNFATSNDGYILVTDMQGRIIHKDENVSATNKINLTNVAKGEYVLKIYLCNQFKEWIIVKD